MRRSRVLAPVLAAGLALTACSGGDDAATGRSSASSTTPAPSVELTERGNVPAEVGEMTGWAAPPGVELPGGLAFGVEGVVINPRCDSGIEQEPASGNYLGLQMRITTSPEYDVRGVWSIQETDFHVYGPDGVELEDPLGNASTCFDSQKVIPDTRLNPGRTYTGWLVLDVPFRTGSVVYAPYGGETGWEWQF